MNIKINDIFIIAHNIFIVHNAKLMSFYALSQIHSKLRLRFKIVHGK